ncbi:alcohol dehydrogenase catalytic domain-containing protein [Thermocatellispora tengchongensis]
MRGQGAVRLALLWTAYFIMMAGFYLAASWTPRLLEQSGYSAGQGVSGGVLLNLGGIAGTLLFGALALRAPGRVLTMLAFLAAGAAFLTMGLVLGTTAAALAAAVAVGISVNAAGAGLNAGAPGLYPAGVRATGAGWAMAFGRLGALTAPRPGGAAPGPLPGPGDAVQHVRAAAGRGRARGRRHHLVRRAGLCARAHDQGEPMKAVRLHDYHKHPVVDEVPEPEPSGPLDVIVRIGGAGVCRTDLHIIEGQWAEAMAPRLPYTIGHENAGWVHAVGEGVTNVRVGDTVILHPQPSCGLCPACRAGRDMQCADAFFPGVSGHDGGMAEYLRTTARACVRLDPDTDPADVAALADAGITAYHAVRKALPLLHPGTSAVVLGAGGLGHIGVQALAALTAARIIVVDRNPGALHLAASIGADATVPADGDHVEAVRALTGGRGADVVFDFVAEQGAEQDAWEMTAPAGSLFVVGYGGELWIPTMALVAEEKNVIGNMVGTYTDLAELMVLAQAGKVTLHTVRYPLEEAPRALDDLALGRIRGRAILVP